LPTSRDVRRQKTMKKGTADNTDTAQKDLRAGFIRTIRSAVEKGRSFHEACSLLDIPDVDMRESVVNDALKLLIAEMHYGNGMPLKQLALKLRLSLSRLLNAKENISDEDRALSGHPQGSRERLHIA